MTSSQELQSSLRPAEHVFLTNYYMTRTSLGHCLLTEVSQQDEEPRVRKMLEIQKAICSYSFY
jgi:hypothetical protein